MCLRRISNYSIFLYTRSRTRTRTHTRTHTHTHTHTHTLTHSNTHSQTYTCKHTEEDNHNASVVSAANFVWCEEYEAETTRPRLILRCTTKPIILPPPHHHTLISSLHYFQTSCAAQLPQKEIVIHPAQTQDNQLNNVLWLLIIISSP